MAASRPSRSEHPQNSVVVSPAPPAHNITDEDVLEKQGSNYNYIIMHPASIKEKQGIAISDWFPAIPSVVASLLAVFIVHQLTKSREREKTVFELHALVSKLCHELAEVAVVAWTDRPSAARNRKDAEVLWRIQQLGAAIQRLRHLSAKTRWKLWRIFPQRQLVEIAVGEDLITLRKALTSDPFMDPKRSSDRNRGQAVESAKGAFLVALDSQVSQWSK